MCFASDARLMRLPLIMITVFNLANLRIRVFSVRLSVLLSACLSLSNITNNSSATAEVTDRGAARTENVQVQHPPAGISLVVCRSGYTK